MQGTLFFDESETNALFNVRAQQHTLPLFSRPPAERNESFKSNSQHYEHAAIVDSDGEVCEGSDWGAPAATTPEARYHYHSFACNGSMPVPELDAVLSWWLDDGGVKSFNMAGGSFPKAPTHRPVVIHLLLVNNRRAGSDGRSAQAKKMSVELPIRHVSDLLACGVTKLVRGGNCVSVAWLTTFLQAGCLRIVLQREADGNGTLLMTPEGEMVHSQPIRAIATATAAAGGGGSGSGNRGEGGAASWAVTHRRSALNGASESDLAPPPDGPRCGPQTSACVLFEIPTIDAENFWERYDYLRDEFNKHPNPATQPSASYTSSQQPTQQGGSNTTAVAAMFVVTDGENVWRVKLLENGLTSHLKLKDSKSKEQVGFLCAQLNNAALSHGYGALSAVEHPPFSEFTNLQRVTRRRAIGEGGNRRLDSAETGGDENGTEGELTFASMRHSSGGGGDGEGDGAATSGSGDVTAASPQPRQGKAPSKGGWLSRLLGGAGKDGLNFSGTGSGSSNSSGLPQPPKRRFLCVSAVHNSAYIALLRWNGLVEFYDSDLRMVEHFPTCYIPPQELAPSAGLFAFAVDGAGNNGSGSTATSRGEPFVQQWTARNEATNAIHYFASFGTLEGRRCVWARVPAVDRTTDEKVVLRCAYGVVPPASGSAPVACGVNAREELAVLWDVGVEEDAHLLTARSVSSLFNPSVAPVSAALQVVRGARGAEEAWVWRQTDTYLCHASGRLRAVLSEESDFLLVEKTGDFHRAYVLQSVLDRQQRPSGRGVSRSTVDALVETVRVDLSDVGEGGEVALPLSSSGGDATILQCVVSDSFGSNGGVAGHALRALRLVPTTNATATLSAAEVEQSIAIQYFMEGCDTLQSCVHGATLLSALLRDALTASFSGQQLMPALSRIMHEAHLAGHVPSRLPAHHDGLNSSEAHRSEMCTAIEAALAEATRVPLVRQHVHSMRRSEEAGDAPFCSFGRHYILSAVLRSLLNRIAFLVVTLIGICSSTSSHATAADDAASPAAVRMEEALERSIAVHAMPASKEGSVMTLVQTIQLLVAAYHTAQIAGPELSRFAPPLPQRQQQQQQPSSSSPPATRAPAGYASGDDIVNAILARFMYRFNTQTAGDEAPTAASTSLPFFVIQVANALYRARTPRTAKASAAWAAQLQHHFPILTHFRLLFDIDAGRTNRSTQQQDMCMKVVRSLSALGESTAMGTAASERCVEEELRTLPVQCLLDEGFLVADAPHCSALARLLNPGSSGFNEVRAWAVERATLSPKLYAVGILRRLIPNLNNSNTPWLMPAPGNKGGFSPIQQLQQQPSQQPQRRAAVSATAVRHYYLTELMQVRSSVVAMHDKAQREASSAAPTATTTSTSVSHTLLPYAWDGLRTALDELLLDTLLYLSQCAIAEFDFYVGWHDLEAALELAEELDVLYLYVDPFHAILAKVVECACAAQCHLDHLISTSSTTYAAVALEEILVVKWYNYIARMPTKSASDATEALRYRAIMGLYRYLMSRHAYAQCGRTFSDLASLLRCSPLRRTGGGSTISVGELAALALSAVEQIAPHAPVEESPCIGEAGEEEDGGQRKGGARGGSPRPGSNALHGSPISSGFAWRSPQQQQQGGRAGSRSSVSSEVAKLSVANHYASRRPGYALASSPLAGSAAAGHAARLLSRDDLPWLRRRVYQAHCERQLWRRGSTLDCTDIWVDGAPLEDFLAGVKKLTTALEEAELWPEAYRFATLAEVDPVPVLQHWAIHLTRRTRRLNSHATLTNLARNANHVYALDNEREAIFDEWQSVMQYCEEQSCLGNQFAGYSRVLLEVLCADYEATAPELRDAHRDADPYTAAATLLQVFTILRRRLTTSCLSAEGGRQSEENGRLAIDREQESGACAEEEDDEGEEADDARENRAELADRREALSWLPWAAAALICTEALTVSGTGRSDGCGCGIQRRPEDLDVFTAGVIDPLARYAKQAVSCSAQVKAIVAERHGLQLDSVAAAFMQSVNGV